MAISKIYWIVHPAYPLKARSTTLGYTPSEIQAFIREKIHPVVAEAARNPDALVVYLKSPRFVGRAPRGISAARHRRLRAVENQLGRHLRRLLAPSRLVVAQGADRAAVNRIVDAVRGSGLRIDVRASTHSFGAFQEQCVPHFPGLFREAMRIHGPFDESEDGVIRYSEARQRATRRRVRP